MVSPSDRLVVHETFTLERNLPHVPARVFSVWSDPTAKRRWFVDADGPEWETLAYELDFREGGREVGEFRHNGKVVHRSDTEYLDIVPDHRIIFAYTMIIDGRRISASLATAQFVPSGGGTLFTYTEQAAYLDRLDKAEARRHGWTFLLDQMTAQLDAAGA